MNRLAKRLDWRLDEMTLFHDLTEAESAEFALMDAELADLEADMVLGTTTINQIARREAEFGVESIESKPLNQRRSVLVAKLRGAGTTTPEYIRSVAESFEYGSVHVVEDGTPYTVTLVFDSAYGIPPNIADFIAAIEEVKPAHLVFLCDYKYITWDEYEAYERAWSAWDGLNLSWDELEVYKG